MGSQNTYPEEEEFVLCTVTGINPHSVFCTLDEYGGRTGMIHISEIAPGRIRNIKEHVQEGKKVVTKVLRIDLERGHIDLSLRRVNDAQKRYKLNQIKQQKFAEKIIEGVAKQTKANAQGIQQQLESKLLPEHESLFAAFEEVSKGTLDLTKAIEKNIAAALTETIQNKIKPPQVRISGALTLTSYEENGLDIVKKTLAIAVDNNVDVMYLGAGKYQLEVIAEEYKDAEKTMKKAVDLLLAYAEKNNLNTNWERKED